MMTLPELFPDEIERAYSDRLQGYARFLAQLGVNPPYHWIAGLTGIKGRRLAIDGGFPRECLSETIIVEGTYDGKQTPTNALCTFFGEIYSRCGVRWPDHVPS